MTCFAGSLRVGTPPCEHATRYAYSVSETLPEQIGRYTIRRELGRGAMGVVYEADDPVLGRRVAIKTISLDLGLSPEATELYRQRFLGEARAAASMSHPGIVVVYDVGQHGPGGQLYMALEYLVGETVEERLARQGTIDWRPALRIASEVARALNHAHTRKIVHRDIKPANIMLLESGETKILDFGIARLPTSQLTTGGESFGTPAYMSPEAALEEGLDGRSDLFSLGVVLYEMLTGRRAFTGSSIPAILTRVAYEDPSPPSDHVETLPPELNRLFARLLAKDPDDRYANGVELAEDLGDVLERRPPRHLANWTAPELPRRTIARAPRYSIEPLEQDGKSPVDTQRVALSLAMPPGKRVSLAILEGPNQGAVLPVEKPRILIGRTGGRAGAEVEVPDPEVSRTHASLELYGKKVVLRDLDSTNGTFVGDQRISDCELHHQSEFRAGHTRFMLVLADHDES